MKEYSKRTNLSQNEKNIHKERIAFMIIDDEILFLKNSELSHFMWAKQLGVPESIFSQIVRGYYKNGKASFYKGNFEYDNECIECAKRFATEIKEYVGVSSIECWCGHKVGKIGEEWPSLYFVGEF